MKNKRLLIFLLILVVNLLPHIYVSFSQPDTLLNWYLTDDAFYYFKTAQNIAEGAGITFDGIAPTNGFHPLWMIVCVPIFALARFDLFLPMRVLIVVQAVLNALSGYLLYRLFADRFFEEIGWIAAAFWMFFPPIHGITTKLGLESGINALSILFLFYCLSRLPEKIKDQDFSFKQYLGVTLAAVFCLLSRLDNIFIVLMVGVWLVFRFSSLRQKLLLDFILIILAVVISYYSRIQTTNNIFNFLPFFYLLAAFSLVIKPVTFYFFGLFDIDHFKNIKHVLLKSIAAITLSSLMIAFVFFIIHDLMHAFRGFSRSVLIIDWLISLAYLCSFTDLLVYPLSAIRLRGRRPFIEIELESLAVNRISLFFTLICSPGRLYGDQPVLCRQRHARERPDQALVGDPAQYGLWKANFNVTGSY